MKKSNHLESGLVKIYTSTEKKWNVRSRFLPEKEVSFKKSKILSEKEATNRDWLKY